ncbi:alpha/beta fold hydrolase [Spirillospora sp. CA-294931]|uniref:alpha/beta fold hydrolase n=1 Tax=Spirillospora sp. CA-294931 TaxID=3240042 RepID=UPI003D92B9DF
MTQVVELSSGPVRFRDTGGEGPVLVFVHGLFHDGTVWRPAVEALGRDFRCVSPDLPLGAHTLPMRHSADLSPLGVARMVREFIDVLGLSDVTLVGTDTGGAVVQLLLADGCEKVGRVVLTPCDSFGNFLPPSLRGLQYLSKVPGLLGVAAQPLRAAWARRIGYRWLSRRPLDPDDTARWVRPLVADRRIARDTARFIAAIDRRSTLAAAETLRGFTRPVLLVWPRELPYFPFAHAERWARILPDARLVEIPDSYALVCRDQPRLLADAIAGFAVPARSA